MNSKPNPFKPDELAVKVHLTKASPSQEEWNRQLMDVCQQVHGQCKLRFSLTIYGPGDEKRSTNRYHAILGYNPTVSCSSQAVANAILTLHAEWLSALNDAELAVE